MCGISGVVGLNNISDELYQGIRNLEYRGYDSCGVALMNKKSVVIRKNTGGCGRGVPQRKCLSVTFQQDRYCAYPLGHARQQSLKNNTHPFTSCDGKFAVVHNGIISNFRPLKDKLKREGHKFTSETDTEVIPHLLEKYYKQTKNIEKALVKVVNVLEGTFAMAFITSIAPGQIFCAKRESPLMLGIGDEAKYVGSDFNAFIDYTKNAIIIDDGEYAIISRDSYVVKDSVTGREIQKEITKIEWDSETSKKGGYPHYMLKEIYEQPQVVTNALEQDSQLLDDLAQMVFESEKMPSSWGLEPLITLPLMGTIFFLHWRESIVRPSVRTSSPRWPMWMKKVWCWLFRNRVKPTIL